MTLGSRRRVEVRTARIALAAAGGFVQYRLCCRFSGLLAGMDGERLR